MITNTQLFKDALVLAGVLSEVENPSAEQGSSALRTLNEMLAEWEEDGIELGFFEQTSLSANCPLPDSAVSAVKYNLASKFGDEYGMPLSPKLEQLSQTKYKRLVRATIDTEEADMTHLPGSLRYAYDINDG